MIGIKQTSRVNSIIVAIKIFVALLFIAIGAYYVQPENYHPFLPPNTGAFGEFGISGVLRAAGTLFFAYVGFDSVSTAAQETKNPQKNIPIGILTALAISTGIYILFGTVLTGLVNYKELDVAAPVALALSKTPYAWLGSLVKLAVLAGFTSVILVMLLGQSRIFYAMARDGLLPTSLATIHPKWHTPYISSFILMVFVGLISAFAPLELLSHMTSIGTLLAFVTVCFCVLRLRKLKPEASRPFKVPFSPLFPILGIAFSLILIASLGLDNWIRLFVWLFLGLAIYFWQKRRSVARNTK
jgi:APA family basic amino acid/polyamine antiporter